MPSTSLHCCSWSSPRRSRSISSSISELTPEGESRGSRTHGEISQKHITTKEWCTQSLIPQHCSCPSSGSGLVIVGKRKPKHDSKTKPSWSSEVPMQSWQEFSPQHCCPGIWQDVPSAVLSKQQITSYSYVRRGFCRQDPTSSCLQESTAGNEANYFKNREGSRRSTCEDQDKVTGKSKYFHIQDKFL